MGYNHVADVCVESAVGCEKILLSAKSKLYFQVKQNMFSYKSDLNKMLHV